MSAWSTGKLRRELLRVHGIGPETADAILCFAFERPVFVADQYARRWLQRMGFTPGGRSLGYEAARRFVEDAQQWSAVFLQELHAAIVIHAQTVCGRRPDCDNCSIKQLCNTHKNR